MTASKRQPTVTSFALLSLLSIQPWGAYELAQQLERGLHLIWPRVGRSSYFEAKKLVDLGLATATKEASGAKRKRTVYAITDAGRKALRTWHASREISLTVPESEAMLRISFADQEGTTQDLLAAARAMQTEAEFGLGVLRRQRIEEMLEHGSPYPERLRQIMLSFPWFEEFGLYLHRYSSWVIETVERWESMSDEEVRAEIDEYFTSRADGSLGTVGPSASAPGEPKRFPLAPWT